MPEKLFESEQAQEDQPHYGDLVAFFVETCRATFGQDPPRQIRDRVGKEAGVLIREKTDPDVLKTAIEILVEKGLDPSMLASCAFTAQAQLQGMTRADRKLLSAFLAQIEQTHGLRWPTGATFKRSISSGTYVEDPLGLDWPTYDVPWSRPTRASVVQALKERSNGE